VRGLFYEIFNSALETAIDLFTAEYSNQARVAKNLAAGAVLVTALNALIVGVLLFCPRIGAMLK
jgi:diacylglycerol kinase